MAGFGIAGSGGSAAARGKYFGARGHVGARRRTHRICDEVDTVYVQPGWKRLAGDHHGGGSSVCAAIFSGRAAFALHDSGYETAHFFVVGSFSRWEGAACGVSGLE